MLSFLPLLAWPLMIFQTAPSSQLFEVCGLGLMDTSLTSEDVVLLSEICDSLKK